MKPILTRLGVAGVTVVILQFLAIALFFSKALFPPTLLTGLAANVVYDAGPIGAVMVIGFHLLILVVVNVWLLAPGFRDGTRGTPRACIPSIVWTALLTALSVRYWMSPIAVSQKDGALGGIQAGLRMQGAAHVNSHLAINGIVFVVAVLVLFVLIRKRAAPASWLTYNAGLQVLLCFVIFPWLGGYP